MMKKEKEFDRIINFLIGNVQENPCLIVIGVTNIPSFIMNKSKKYGEDKLKIIVVNEAFTTKQCSNCNEECFVSKTIHRYVLCKNFNVMWERDINAGRNIFNIGLYLEGLLTGNDILKPTVFPAIRHLFLQ